ncbi:hypothetical protein [Amycolatopsis sp. NBC_00438]
MAALLAAVRSGDTAARAEVLAAARPVIGVVVRASGLDDWAVVQAIAAELAREIERFDNEDAVLDWLIVAVAQAKSRHEPRSAQQIPPDDSPGLPLSSREKRFLRALTSSRTYDAVAEELRIPVGSIGPYRVRVYRKLRRLLETEHVPEPRANLEAALRSHSPAPASRAPRRGLLHFLGLTTPAPTPPTRPADRTIVAVRDVTGAGRDVLRELDVVLTMTREGEGLA